MLISGLIGHADGPPARVADALLARRLSGVASPTVFEELGRVLRRPWFAERVSVSEREAYVGRLQACMELVADESSPPRATRDPGDDYLVALARGAKVDAIVSGDKDLLDLVDPDLPVLSPRELADRLGETAPEA